MPRRAKRKSKTKRRTRNPSPEWFEIEQILDERVIRGKIEYLIDWAGTDDNGNRWDPTWEKEVTPDEIEKWELKKKGPSAQNEPAKRTRPPEDSDDDDEPIPPSKRRKVRPLQISSKGATSSLSSLEPESELATPATEYSEHFTPLRNQQIYVSIKEPAINRSEYLSISTTQSGSQLISELEEEDNRVVVASELSQGTIPDSQDITAGSWSQSQLIPSVEAAEVSQSQEDIIASLPESSLVIPDSQDLSTNLSVFEPIVSPVNELSSRNQVAPEQTQQETVPDTGTADAEIPSRQPEQSSPPPFVVIGNHELSTTTSGSHVNDQQSQNTLAPATHSPRSPDSGLIEPAFLTQVPASLELPPLESSGESRVLESSRDKLNATSIENRESIDDNRTSLLQESSNQSQSQAAQDVTCDFELLYESPINCCDAGSKVRHADTSLSPGLLTTKTQVEGNLGQSVLTQTSSLTLSKPSNQTRTKFKMEGSRPSAADQIRMAFGSIDPDIEDAIVRRPAVSQSQVEPFMGADIGVTSINPSVTIRSPHLHNEADLPSHNDQWATSMGPSEQFLPPDSISPASLIKNPSQSVAHGLLELVDKSFGDAGPSIASTLTPDISSLPPTTVSPAEISNSIDPGELSHTIPPLSDNGTTSSRLEGSSGQSITMGQIPDEHDFDEPSSPTQPERAPLQYLVTLPFQASSRPVYDDLVAKYRPDAETFSGYFSRDTAETPTEPLVGRIDEFLSKLTNVCDYPQHLVGTSLEELPTSKQAKYVRDANSKFNFVFELLKDIHKETEILIVAGTPELLRILFSITEELELECTSNNIGRTSSEFQGSLASVQLILGTEEHDPFQYDVVIGFDHSFNGSLVAKAISSGGSSSSPPLILQLLTTHSIEHIAVHINSDLSSMERRNALLLGIAKARRLVQDPDEDKEHEPHTAAQVFSEYFNGITDTIQWEPRSIPDDVLDIFVNSQYRSQVPQDTISQGIGLKHKLVDDDSNEENAKRIRLGPSEELSTSLANPPIPDSVRMLLKGAESKAATHKLREAKMRVSIASMMILAEQVAELERQSEARKNETDIRADIISELEKRANDYERTTNRQAELWRRALEDRHNFEKEVRKIESAAKAAQEAAEQESLRKSKVISDLNERIATLTASPEGSEESAVGRLDRLLKETQDKNKVLQRKLENATNDGNYVRDEYQKATFRAGTLNSENKELREANEELTKKSSENLTTIQEIQRDQTIKEHLKTIENLRAQLKDKDTELEQLRVLKNGRPQTRQASVPRSPRTSMMSPRTGRFGSSASRGTSPAPAPGYEGNGSSGLPGMQYMSQQPGNGRWGHLRD